MLPEEGNPRPLDSPIGRHRSHSFHSPPSPRRAREYERDARSLDFDAQSIIDPLLALPRRALTETFTPALSWDVIYSPAHALREHREIAQGDLLRPAACLGSPYSTYGARPLRAFTLVVPLLPAHAQTIVVAAGADHAYASVWDALDALYCALRVPVGAAELGALGAREQAALLQAAEERGVRFQEDARRVRDGLLRVDYLGRRRMFIGIRPAAGWEVPRGLPMEEVFVVELEKSGR